MRCSSVSAKPNVNYLFKALGRLVEEKENVKVKITVRKGEGKNGRDSIIQTSTRSVKRNERL